MAILTKPYLMVVFVFFQPMLCCKSKSIKISLLLWKNEFEWQSSRAAEQQSSRAAEQQSSRAAEQQSSRSVSFYLSNCHTPSI
jgi:hypothetical protein